MSPGRYLIAEQCGRMRARYLDVLGPAPCGGLRIVIDSTGPRPLHWTARVRIDGVLVTQGSYEPLPWPSEDGRTLL